MAKGKPALGRGLSALLSDSSGEGGGEGGRDVLQDARALARLAGRIVDVKLDLVDPNPYQPRRDFDEEALHELSASIQQLGVIQPITVRAAEGGRFEIISGERRVRASRRAGMTAIPAYVREADTEAMLEMAIVENVQREELNPMEIALGYQRLIDECDLTQERVAEKVGKGRATVANMLRLLKLPAAVQAALRDGSISTGHARALIPVDDEEAQATLLAQIIDQGWSVRDIERAVKKRSEAAEKDRTAQMPQPVRLSDAGGRDELVLRSMTDRLRTSLGTKVQIKPSSGKEGGRIELDYFSDEDLERLIELITS